MEFWNIGVALQFLVKVCEGTVNVAFRNSSMGFSNNASTMVSSPPFRNQRGFSSLARHRLCSCLGFCVVREGALDVLEHVGLRVLAVHFVEHHLDVVPLADFVKQ